MLAAVVLAQCFVVNDPSPGWKQVALPAAAPHLAGPKDFQQFRTSEPVRVTHELPQLLLSSNRERPGVHLFEFALPADGTTLRLRFAKPLDSAKVDATLEGPRGRMALFEERRVTGAVLELPLSLPDANRAWVRIHTHLRGAPTLEAATLERTVHPLQSNEFPGQLKLENALYVLSRGGPFSVCERPGQSMKVTVQALRGPVVSVSMAPAR